MITAMTLVKDRVGLVEAAARSVLAQEGVELELVILDDGSTDDTWNVVSALASTDDRVRLLRNERSVGIPAARNQVLAAARGAFVAICDSDDHSRPGRFVQQEAAFAADPDLVGVGGQISCFTHDPATGSVPRWHWGLRDGRLPFPFPGAMFRVDALRAAGGFDETFPMAEDLELCYRLAAHGGAFTMLDQVVLDYRVHQDGVSSMRRRREWHTLRAQLAGVRHLHGRLSPRGYAVIAQTAVRTLVGGPRTGPV